MDISIAQVDTARNGLMWEVLAYDAYGNEIGERFNTEERAQVFADKLEKEHQKELDRLESGQSDYPRNNNKGPFG